MRCGELLLLKKVYATILKTTLLYVSFYEKKEKKKDLSNFLHYQQVLWTFAQ